MLRDLRLRRAGERASSLGYFGRLRAPRAYTESSANFELEGDSAAFGPGGRYETGAESFQHESLDLACLLLPLLAGCFGTRVLRDQAGREFCCMKRLATGWKRISIAKGLQLSPAWWASE